MLEREDKEDCPEQELVVEAQSEFYHPPGSLKAAIQEDKVTVYKA